MPIEFAGPLLLALAVALAAGFHRIRAAQIFVLLSIAAAGLLIDDERIRDGTRRFIPWLVLALSILPEARWLARRTLVYWLVASIVLALAIAAPEHVVNGLGWCLSAPLGFASAERGALIVLGLGAVACLTRWVLGAQPIDLALSLVLLLMLVAFNHPTGLAFAAVGVAAMLAVLYSSYRMAFVDGLTSLPNRRALDETLQRLTGAYSLAMIDVDHFKKFNDTYGHDAGDIVLRMVGRVMRRRVIGKTFRYGGEEFCVVFEAIAPDRVAASLEVARAALEAERIFIPKSGRRVPNKSRRRDQPEYVAVTISIGHAQKDATRRHPSEVLKAADSALYKAKDLGRNRVCAA